MLLSAVSVLVVAQSSSEFPEELMNNPVYATCLARGFMLHLFRAILKPVWTYDVQLR